MTGDGRGPAPLRPGDPRALGPYTLTGRLGQGGMGTVYLAVAPGGALVAVKMIRADLAPDDEFRRRFRSEVDRVRQVPPFCTAEVLDADPDHEHPYLVVEYVDGPSLAEVVQQRGPLTAANLHGVAIGVATALTAIHGAGVIHRDLKPRNVLLAPGSPKVIDFGIARAMEATTRHTGTDQMVGTVAYMAPERFGPEEVTLTTAADIFAWGAVVAYAGVGRTPFAADSAPATAGRILTQPPDLSGLNEPLRSLVAHALAKNPADRPTARELLDLLLSSGARQSAATTAALAHQPGLRDAAREAQAATDHAELSHGQPAPAAWSPAHDAQATGISAALNGPTQAIALPGTAIAEQPTVVPRQRGPIPAQAPAEPHVPGGPAAPQGPGGPATPLGPGGPAVPLGPGGPAVPVEFGPAAPATPATKRPGPRLLVVAVLVALLCGGVSLAWTGIFPGGNPFPPHYGGGPPTTTTLGGPGDSTLLFSDPLVARKYWNPSADPEEKAGCSFSGALIVRRQSAGSFRCQGPADEQSPDQRVDVGVRLLRKGSCASIWFRFTDSRGYQVRVCESAIYVGTHKSAATQVYKTIPLDRPLPAGHRSTRISVSARGDRVDVSRDGAPLAGVPLTDPDIVGGRVILGIFTEPRDRGHKPPFEVAFDNVSVWSLRP